MKMKKKHIEFRIDYFRNDDKATNLSKVTHWSNMSITNSKSNCLEVL